MGRWWLQLSKLLGGAFLGLSLSSCFWPGLPDVRILKTQYPVVHSIKCVGERSSPSTPHFRNRLKADSKHSFITFEKTRPASWVPVDEVSKVAIGAIIVSEDWAFYHHRGYDPAQIKEALNRDIDEGKYARGASTITQQVAKNVFLDSEKSILRKLKELVLAIQLEQNFKKRKILEVYLNVAEWGDGIYGIGPAARFYFGKSPAELTAKEGAFLAMLLPSPIRYSQSFRSKHLTRYASKTVSEILHKMVEAGYLTEEEETAQQDLPLSFELP